MKLYDFQNNGRYHVLRFPGNSSQPIIRIESACTFAMIYGSSLCDCRQQLEMSIKILSEQSGGILIYCIDENARGIGTKDDAYKKHIEVYMEEQKCNVDTVEAHIRLGHPVDGRNYNNIVTILESININQIKLLSNNPQRIDFFNKRDMLVERIPLLAKIDKWNRKELTAKKEKMGHLLKL